MRPRIYEYRFALDHLKPYRVLDVGCCESFLSLLLAHCDLEVYGCDVQRCYPKYETTPYKYNKGTFKFIYKDVRLLDFPDQFFDTIINISTVEHIGLRAYDQKLIDPDGDIKAMENIRRMLKIGGVLIFTCPYGKGGLDWMRVYDNKRLIRLLEGFEINAVECRLYDPTNDTWNLVSMELASNVETDNTKGANLCLKAVRVD